MKYLPVVLAMVVLAGVALFVFSISGNDVDLVIESGQESLHIQHAGATLLPPEELTIKFSDIERVEFLESLPSMRKVNGLGNLKVKIGAFRTDDIGDFRAYVYLKAPGHLVLYTQAGTYVVSHPDASDIYREVQDHISNR